MHKMALARRLGLLGVSLAALALSQGVRAEDGPDHAAQNAADHIKTASPIKHVLIIVGENRSFDHLFATYVPKSDDERVLNLLSERIVKVDGTPNEAFDRAHQFQITSAPNGGKFFISAGSANKSLYSMLPAPDLGGVQNPPAAAILGLPGGDPGLPAADQFLFGTGGTGLPNNLGPDTRITNVNTLPPGPFQLTGPTMPYDAYTADTIHQFFQMYQQMDCAIDAEHVTRRNPTGCLHDLQSAITTTYSTPPGGTPHDTGQTMAFFNMQKGDVPYLKFLADNYSMSDNYHQPVMGGTGPDSVPLGFADQVFFGDGHGNAATPPATSTPSPAGAIPPVTMTSIGDLLSAKNIPWKYYGGSYNVSGTGTPLDGIYCNICNPFEYQLNYPAMRADHMRDVTDLFQDLKNGTLPAVSYVKPDGALDGHPASSKFGLFEAFAKNIIELAQGNKEQWESTAIFVTVDEGGGYYDSGFIQPVDFFGTGPRIPMIAVSPFSRGGHVTHVYGEHSSFVKFVERNWYLGKLSQRSRDNLPNPRADDDHPYVPVNMPAIGDLFDMFDFDRDHDHDRDGDRDSR